MTKKDATSKRGKTPSEQQLGPRVSLAHEGPVAWITIENPTRRNAMTAAMWEALPGLIKKASETQGARVVVLRGSGEAAFCAGADISEFESQLTGKSVEHYNTLNHNAFLALQNCSLPTLAMIHGFCMGGGLSLALSCDLRLASDDAQFSIPAAKLGISYHPRWVGDVLKAVSPARAKELFLTAQRFDAAWARDSGLINRLVKKSELDSQTRELAKGIAENAPLSLKAAKRIVDALSPAYIKADQDHLEKLVAACFDSEDYVEGRNAFNEKRKPQFTGR